MLKLSQFHLQFAFVTARPLGENIQDQADPIQYPASGYALHVAFLGRAQFVIEKNQFRIHGSHDIANFLNLALADKETRIRQFPLAVDHDHGRKAGRFRKLNEFVQLFIEAGIMKIDMDQNGPDARGYGFTQGNEPLKNVSAFASIFVGSRHFDAAGGHNG